MAKKKVITIQREVPSKFKPLLKWIKKRVKNVSRQTEKAIVNRHSGSSIAIRDDGSVNIVSGASSQYKLSKEGKATELSLESHTITNRRSVTADEFVLNDHKLNPKLYEYTDMKQVLGDENTAVGNFTVFGTVLVKAWEPNLKKYVLIRRLARIPVFSPKLNTPDIHPQLGVETDLEKEFEELSKMPVQSGNNDSEKESGES